MSAEMITAIGAIIVGLGSLLGAILAHRKTVIILEEKMKGVEKKLDTHNGYAKMFSESSDRISKIEKDLAVIATNLDWVRKEMEK